MTAPTLNTFSQFAPLLIDKYESYLPSAFSDNLTMLQKVNMIINSLNTLGTNFNSVVDQWNEAITWVEGEGLTDAVTVYLDAMVADGTLASLINDDFTKKLDTFVFISAYTGVDLTGATSSQTAIVQAVSDAYTKGKTLYWESGTYLSTASIPNLHKVKHEGDGIIKRGANLFYVNPKQNQTNTLYVVPVGGVAGNDGLSNTESPATLSEAFNLLPNYGPVLGGSWVFQLYAGTYKHAYFPSGLKSANPITVNGVNVGGHPIVPQTIISDGTNQAGSGIYCDHGTRVILNNLKATGYSQTGNGFAVAYGSEMTCNNCHTDGNYYGMQALHHATLIAPDGIQQNNTYGIYSIQLSNHYIGIQNSTDVSKGIIIQNNTYGFSAKEFSTGHVNFCTITGNGDGIYLYRLASVNGDGIVFSNNTRDVRQVTGGNFSPTSATVFGSTSGTSLVNDSGFAGGTNYISEYDMSYMSNERIVDIVNYNNYIKTTTTTTFLTATLKTPHWKLDQTTFNKGKGFTFKVYGECDGSADLKHIQVKLTDGTNFQTAGFSFAASQNGEFYVYGTVYFLNQTDVYLVIEGNVHQMPKFVDTEYITTLDKTKDLTLSLGGYVANTADSLKIEVAELRTFG